MKHASRTDRMTRLAEAAVIALAGVLALAGCVATVPTTAPSISGAVTGLVAGDGRPDSISVESSATGAGSGADKAFVSIPPNTEFFGADGKPASLDSVAAIKVGTKVRVWFTGPVAESYPVQATAQAVQIIAP